MTSELSPTWSKPRMTQAQVRKYIQDMKNAQKIAEEKLKKAKENWEFDKEEKDIEKLEKLLD